jgi:catechol 2,3-dioxygenase-like lactoylglutathione lyase family enzyme
MTMQVPDAAQAAEDLARHGVRITEQRPHHFVADPATTHGVPIEFTDAALPDDPRLRPGWEPPAREADPLQLQGLWSVTMLVDDVAAGDRFFQKVLGAQNVGERMGGEFAKKSKFYLLGASRVSIMVPKEDGSELIKVIETQGLGIHGVCLNTTDVHPVARFLRRQGLGLLGSPEVRLTIHPHGFLGARYLFMRRPDPDDPHFIWHQPLSAQGRKP